MRIAIVSDVHGNLTALESVLADLKQSAPDVVIHGGDLAHGGAHPAEVVDRIRELGWLGVCGNTDEMLWAPERLRAFASASPTLSDMLAAIEETIPVTCEQLGEERIAWLKTLPYVQRTDQFAIVHAQPRDLWRAPGPKASDHELLRAYEELEVPMVVYGHIHESYVRELSGMTMAVANSGSVSLSYDGDTRASYLIIEEAKAEIRRVAYDLDQEIAALGRSSLPHAEWICRTLRAGHYVPLKSP